MNLSGIIFVVLALAWAVYLIPKALKHHDELARTRSIDRFSTAMRVLARREPAPKSGARVVVAPARSADNPRMLTPRTAAPQARRAAARAAARRRRRILSFLVLATVVVATLAGFGQVPWWSVSIPAGLTVLYLVLCRTQVRRERSATWSADLAAAAEAAPVAKPVKAGRSRRAARVDAPFGTPVLASASARAADRSVEGAMPDEDTIAIPAAVLDAVAVPTVDGGSLWDPLPVTLPTYVTKPKARRTVRTIELDEPGTWSSGRSDEDSRLVADTAAAEADEHVADEVVEEQQRAVGS